MFKIMMVLVFMVKIIVVLINLLIIGMIENNDG